MEGGYKTYLDKWDFALYYNISNQVAFILKKYSTSTVFKQTFHKQ